MAQPINVLSQRHQARRYRETARQRMTPAERAQYLKDKFTMLAWMCDARTKQLKIRV